MALSFVAAPAVRSSSSSVASPLAGGVPASFAVVPGVSPVSRFVPVAGGARVVLSGLAPFTSRAGARGLRVSWRCVVSGLSGSVVCLSRGFPGGEGSPAARAFLGAVRSAVSSGVPVFLAGAPGASGAVASGYFCALSVSPFVASVAPAADPFAGF